MNYFLRTNNVDMTSFGGFQWPTEVGAKVTAPKWDTKPMSPAGLWGLKDGLGDLGFLFFNRPLWVVFEADTEVAICDGACYKVPEATVSYIGTFEGAVNFLTQGEMSFKEWLLSDPQWSLEYSSWKKLPPDDAFRTSCCRDPYTAYMYALYVDKCPRDDTRKAVSCGAWYHKQYEKFECRFNHTRAEASP